MRGLACSSFSVVWIKKIVIEHFDFVVCAGRFGQVPKWPKGADCKSAGLCLPRFESLPAHQTALVWVSQLLYVE